MNKLTGCTIDEIEELGFVFHEQQPMEFGEYYKVYKMKGVELEYTISYDIDDQPLDDGFELFYSEIKTENLNKKEWQQLINLLKKAFDV